MPATENADNFYFDPRMGMRMRKPQPPPRQGVARTSKCEDSEDEESACSRRKVMAGVSSRTIFNEAQCSAIEAKIEEIVFNATNGDYRASTVEESQLRTRYFFGEGHSRNPKDDSKLYPAGEVDPIPACIHDLVIGPIVEAGIVPRGFINSVILSDFAPGSFSRSQVHPSTLFDRPIIMASFLSETTLSFGSNIKQNPLRSSEPITSVSIQRGDVLGIG